MDDNNKVPQGWTTKYSETLYEANHLLVIALIWKYVHKTRISHKYDLNLL